MPNSAALPLLIGLTGLKRSGKDSVAAVLEDYGFRRLAISDPIRRIADAIGWDGSKEEIPPCSCCGLAQGRELLQLLGSEGLRSSLSESVLLDHLMLRIVDDQKFVVTDLRFPSEAKALRAKGASIWKVVRKPESVDPHISERSVQQISPDVVIDNRGSLADLAHEVEVALARVAHSG